MQSNKLIRLEKSFQQKKLNDAKQQEKTNLSSPLSTFIGREDDLDTLYSVLEPESIPLLTLLGPGGIGKTRLAIQYGLNHLRYYQGEGGVWFCDFSEKDSLDGLLHTLANTLSIILNSNNSLSDNIDQIGYALSTRGKILLILDNFELLVQHAPKTLGVWLKTAPRAQFLVTSRERLNIEGERSFPLNSLSTEEGRMLFIERAKLLHPDYKTLKVEEEYISKIIDKLDGIPLAIELAAAKTNILAPKTLLARLDKRFDILKGGKQQTISRQKTLANSIDWSFELLTPHEKEAFCQCAVFHNGFFLEAAEEIFVLPQEAPCVLELIQNLEQKSMLRTYRSDEFPKKLRLAMYESIREYALQIFQDSTYREDVLLRHQEYYLTQGEFWARKSESREWISAVQYLHQEKENLFAIKKRTIKNSPAIAARIALSLKQPFFLSVSLQSYLKMLQEVSEALPSEETILHAHLILAQNVLKTYQKISDNKFKKDCFFVLTLSKKTKQQNLKAEALQQLGSFYYNRYNHQKAITALQYALSLFRKLDNLNGQVNTLDTLGLLYIREENFEKAHAFFQKALTIVKKVGNTIREASIYGNMGNLYFYQENFEKAKEFQQKALQTLYVIKNPRNRGTSFNNLAGMDFELGRLQEAQKNWEKSLYFFQQEGSRTGESLVLGNLGYLEQTYGNFTKALSHYQKVLAKPHRVKNKVFTLSHLGSLYYEIGQPKNALLCCQKALSLCHENDYITIRLYMQQGVYFADQDQIEKAETYLLTSKEKLEKRPHSLEQNILHLCYGHLDLSLSRQAKEKRDTVTAKRYQESAYKRLDKSKNAPFGQQIGLIPVKRILIRALQKEGIQCEMPTVTKPNPTIAIDTNETASTKEQFLISKDGDWFHTPEGKTVSLRTRKSLRFILKQLLQKRLDPSSNALPLQEILAIGWPGETIHPTSAKSRVYTAIKTLRKLGLDTFLQRTEEGYLLDPNTEFIPSDDNLYPNRVE